MPLRTWQFHVEGAREDDVLILSLTGRLGQASVNLAQEALAHTGPGGVLVDMAGLDYISGPGLAVFRDAADRARRAGRPFVLCGLEGSVRLAFDLAGLLPALTVEANRRRGLARIVALGSGPV